MPLVDSVAQKTPKKDPLERPDYLEADVQALRALSAGVATQQQQHRAMHFLVHELCGTYDMPYRPGSERDTAFACGKQWVGQTIVYFLNHAPTKTSRDEISARRQGEQP